MLRLEGLSRRAGSVTLLRDVSLALEPAEIVSVLGPTGSGKTSLLRLVQGLDVPDRGELFWGTERLATGGRNLRPAHERGFSLAFQEAVLLPFASVADNLLLGVRRRDAAVRARTEELCALLGLEGLEHRSAWKLSGGEQQRVALGRCLMVAPRLLLLDEPFSNLDRAFKQVLFPALERYLNEHAIATIFVTHDRHEAFFFSRRIAVLDAGELSACRPPRELYEEPPSRQAAELLGECNVLAGAEARGILGHDPPDGADGGSLLVRPEELVLLAEEPRNGTLREDRFHGFFRLLRFVCDAGPELAIRVGPEPTLGVGKRYRVALAPAARPARLG